MRAHRPLPSTGFPWRLRAELQRVPWDGPGPLGLAIAPLLTSECPPPLSAHYRDFLAGPLTRSVSPNSPNPGGRAMTSSRPREASRGCGEAQVPGSAHAQEDPRGRGAVPRKVGRGSWRGAVLLLPAPFAPRLGTPKSRSQALALQRAKGGPGRKSSIWGGRGANFSGCRERLRSSGETELGPRSPRARGSRAHGARGAGKGSEGRAG